MRDFATYKLGDGFCHYTCQSIDDRKLSKNNIKMIGDKFGIEAREVLQVPIKTLEKHGYKVRSGNEAQHLIEALLRKL